MIKPILDNILLEPLEEKVNDYGIVRPENVTEKPSIGKILAVGPKVETKEIKKNMMAVYKKWLGNEVKRNGKTYILVAEKDVLGVEE